jgi:hypothetical protein
MTVPRDPTSPDPARPFGSAPLGGPPAPGPTTPGEAVTPTVAAASPVPDGSLTPTTPTAPSPHRPAPDRPTESGSGGAKVKAAALVAGVPALMNKLRKEAPKRRGAGTPHPTTTRPTPGAARPRTEEPTR